ncbi:MAG: TraR/DksA family transcriptional regulator [bacterium]|nr:TraR/DksA family transcriptional regulator [bacterium]
MARATRNKKKSAKMASRQIEIIRKRLSEKRQQIMNLYVHDLRAGQKLSDAGAEDLVDRANDAYNREFMLSLSGSERDALLEVEHALERLDGGDFGQCNHCEEKIPAKRLQAVPWARYCIDCQEQAEQGILLD